MSPDKNTLDELRIDRADAPRNGLAVALVVLLLIALAAAGGALWWFNQPKSIPVRTIVVQETTAASDRPLLNASGYVTARREATVSSKVTGKVVEVFIEEGMQVEAGQMLARIDASNVEKSLQLAEAQLEAARKELGETKATLTRADRELVRMKDLARLGVATQSQLDLAESEALSLEARLERQAADIAVGERELAVWTQQLDDTIIRAPFAGVVTSKDSQPGEMISPISAGGGFTRTGICTIVDMNSLEIEVDVSESYINRVEPGQPVEATLDSYPTWKIPARVIAIIPTADRGKATVKVRVGFDQLDPRILPQMSVKAVFRSAGQTAVAKRSASLPKGAVRQQDGRDVVWVVRDNVVERRAVTVGVTQGDETTIVAGVSGGERVVVEGFEKLSEGARVTEAHR